MRSISVPVTNYVEVTVPFDAPYGYAGDDAYIVEGETATLASVELAATALLESGIIPGPVGAYLLGLIPNTGEVALEPPVEPSVVE